MASDLNIEKVIVSLPTIEPVSGGFWKTVRYKSRRVYTENQWEIEAVTEPATPHVIKESDELLFRKGVVEIDHGIYRNDCHRVKIKTKSAGTRRRGPSILFAN